MDRIHRGLLVRGTRLGGEALLDAVRVGDDERGTVVVLGLVEGLDRGGRIGAHRDVRDVDVLVLHLHEAQVLLGLHLAGRRELGDGAGGGGLGSLAAGVGIHFRVHHQDLDVLARGEHVVETAVADVVRPAVAAQDPDGLADQIVGHREERLLGGALAVATAEELFKLGHRRAHFLHALALDVILVDGLDALEDGLDFGRRFGVGQHLVHQLEGVGLELVGGNAHAETELRIVLEERVRPRRTPTVLALRVRRGGQVAAVDRGAARGVGDEQPVAADLGEELHVRRFAAARARAGELEQRTLELAVEELTS